MQVVSEDYLEILTGSFTPLVVVDAWRNGRLLKANIPVTSGSIQVSADQSIRSRVTLEVAAVDGEFTPRAIADALSPYGSELNIKMGVKVGPYQEMFSQGWFRIQTANPKQSFRSYKRPDEPGQVYRVSTGATVQVECTDRALIVSKDRFVGREQPSGGTVLTEIARLLRGRVPYAGTVGAITNRVVPSDMTYDDDRLKAVTDLADHVDADLVFLPNGSAAVKSRAPGAVVWTVDEGEQGVRVDLDYTLQSDDVYNAVVARGQTADNQVIQAIATVPAWEPLGYEGPFGRVPYYMSSPLLTTFDQVQAAAYTTLARVTQMKPLAVQVVCVMNPAIEVGDMVRLPVLSGFVDGQVTQTQLPFGGPTMTLTVAVDPLVLAALS